MADASLESLPACVLHQMATVAWRNYAAHSYLYYVKDDPVISDGEYDVLCRFIRDNFDWIKPHDLNDYLHLDGLEAGSGFDIAPRVTGQTKDYAEDLLKEFRAKRKNKKPKSRAVEDLI